MNIDNIDVDFASDNSLDISTANALNAIIYELSIIYKNYLIYLYHFFPCINFLIIISKL